MMRISVPVGGGYIISTGLIGFLVLIPLIGVAYLLVGIIWVMWAVATKGIPAVASWVRQWRRSRRSRE